MFFLFLQILLDRRELLERGLQVFNDLCGDYCRVGQIRRIFQMLRYRAS
jgi:hypothetical protein